MNRQTVLSQENGENHVMLTFQLGRTSQRSKISRDIFHNFCLSVCPSLYKKAYQYIYRYKIFALFCLVLIKKFFNLVCVFTLFIFNAGSQLWFRFFFKQNIIAVFLYTAFHTLTVNWQAQQGQ